MQELRCFAPFIFPPSGFLPGRAVGKPEVGNEWSRSGGALGARSAGACITSTSQFPSSLRPVRSGFQTPLRGDISITA